MYRHREDLCPRFCVRIEGVTHEGYHPAEIRIRNFSPRPPENDGAKKKNRKNLRSHHIYLLDLPDTARRAPCRATATCFYFRHHAFVRRFFPIAKM
jgi:hypothetical protein